MTELRKKILIVDDTESVVLVYRDFVTMAGFEAFSAHSGTEALAFINTSPPDLIVLDVMMPDMNGFEVCRRIRKIPAMKKTPILIVTALRNKADEQTAIDSGATAFLSKPLSGDDLVKHIRRHLGSPFR